ncbi:hypothetical protein AcV7_003000 [Taiwanofungus camphoratus]|nr:hypothetical protein AcV7_003000 [Antrodia cinnamomea]
MPVTSRCTSSKVTEVRHQPPQDHLHLTHSWARSRDCWLVQRSSSGMAPTTVISATMSLSSDLPVEPPSSVDPPGTERELIPPWKRVRRAITLEDGRKAGRMPPLDTLPRSLLPSSKTHMLPPILHYSWVPKDTELLQYAEERGLTRIYRWDACFPGEEPGNTVNAPLTMRLALEAIAGELGLQFLAGTLAIKVALKPTQRFIISLYTNYTLEKAISDDAVEKLQRRLGYSDKPKWFLDGERWYWRGKYTAT